MCEEQLDLFSSPVIEAERPLPPCIEQHLDAAVLDDERLLAAISEPDLTDSLALAREAGRRRLTAAVPNLEALCRRFSGFGRRRMLPEQAAALCALGAIAGREAAQSISRLIVREAVQGPALNLAVNTAARIGSTFPPAVLLSLLRHSDPDIRASACGCARRNPAVISVMLELLGDLNQDVARSAACALGRMGRIEARPLLVTLLREQPSEEVIDAVSSVADEECMIQLGRIARTEPTLADAALDALEGADHPRADEIATAARNLQPNATATFLLPTPLPGGTAAAVTPAPVPMRSGSSGHDAL
jgi:HEAT repeat protein